MSDPKPETPYFDIKRYFDTTIEIGDKQIPIRVKRYTRAGWLEFKKGWDTFMGPPRGTEPLTDDQKQEREEQQLAFMEKTIVEAITLDEGYVRDDGVWVTNGDGLINVFFARTGVLSSLVAAVMVENALAPLFRKNSNSPRASDTGSEASIPARGGEQQGPTAASAESSSSAPTAAAEASPDSPEASPSSSGATRGNEEPIVH